MPTAGTGAIQCLQNATIHHGSPIGCNISHNAALLRLPDINDPTLVPLWIFKFLPGWCLNVSCVFWMAAVLTAIVREREERVKETMLVMGLIESAYAASWIASSALMAVPLATLLTLVERGTKMYFISAFWPLLLFNVLYLIALAAFAYGISPLVRQAETANVPCFLLAFASALAYMPLLIATDAAPSALKLALSFNPLCGAHLMGEARTCMQLWPV